MRRARRKSTASRHFRRARMVRRIRHGSIEYPQQKPRVIAQSFNLEALAI
jgi:hypothetical protein